jgi:DNA repair photolyase
MKMNYYELRSAVAKIIPRQTSLFPAKKAAKSIKEKGRKSGYKEFKLTSQEWVEQKRLLNTEEIGSFLEVSCRAAACPMPLNVDVWDGKICPFNCAYCFANSFRASLYSSFFDNTKHMGLRHTLPDKFKAECDKLFQTRDKDPHDVKNPVAKAIAMKIPMRFGIRFEDFTSAEKRKGISLEMLEYLAEQKYPVMVNTKSDLIGEDAYVEALAKNLSAVHITLISSNNQILSALEPGAPTYEARVRAMRNLSEAKIRVVARIEPYLPFINDRPEDIERYIEDVWNAGVKHITFDTYSYTAKNPGIPQAFKNVGMDWERTFLLGCDSQAIGSILLGKFMDLFRAKGFHCSTFDMGNVPSNHDSICCNVGNLFRGFNYGCSVMATRFIKNARMGMEVPWKQFRDYVEINGGFLSPALELETHKLWNIDGNDAYGVGWAEGLTAVGQDRDGLIWIWKPQQDFRENVLEGVLSKAV